MGKGEGTAGEDFRWDPLFDPADTEITGEEAHDFPELLQKLCLTSRFNVLGWIVWLVWICLMTLAALKDIASQSSLLLPWATMAPLLVLPLCSGMLAALHAGLLLESFRREGWLASLCVTPAPASDVSAGIRDRVRNTHGPMMKLAFFLGLLLPSGCFLFSERYQDGEVLFWLYLVTCIALVTCYCLATRHLQWAVSFAIRTALTQSSKSSPAVAMGLWMARGAVFLIHCFFEMAVLALLIVIVGLVSGALAIAGSGELAFALLLGGFLLSLYLGVKWLMRAFRRLNAQIDEQAQQIPVDLSDWLGEA